MIDNYYFILLLLVLFSGAMLLLILEGRAIRSRDELIRMGINPGIERRRRRRAMAWYLIFAIVAAGSGLALLSGCAMVNPKPSKPAITVEFKARPICTEERDNKLWIIPCPK